MGEQGTYDEVSDDIFFLCEHRWEADSGRSHGHDRSPTHVDTVVEAVGVRNVNRCRQDRMSELFRMNV